MVFTRKYNLVNNLTGWGVFIIALVTYWLTLEPTASYWDCGEFIIQADKLEIGHPPGNPIFMLTARFFANFAFGDASLVALMVNAMSGLLSALTILLLFWTVTHLVRRLAVKDSAVELSLPQYLTVMGSGVCAALAYAWSDTFWFSAVEGEVYAFSSFCTALVFWLILKWENRADQPHSDRYLILIAYVIGISIAVHLLNLLCIPAIVLVYCYRKVPDMNVKKSLLALAVGFAIIVLVLYGLVPGFIEVAGWFELLAVNTLGLPFNTGLIAYTVLTVGALCWSLYELYTQRSAARIIISSSLAVLISGILFIGSGIWLGVALFLCFVSALIIMFRMQGRLVISTTSGFMAKGFKYIATGVMVAVALMTFLLMGGDYHKASRVIFLVIVVANLVVFNKKFTPRKKDITIPVGSKDTGNVVRWLNIAMWSIAVIFVGYSSYALILIRSNADTPMNQNSPDNVFALSSYLNREQYGETPLLYGYTFESQPQMKTSLYQNPDYPEVTEQNATPIMEKGNAMYSKGVAGAKAPSTSGFLTEEELEDVESLDARGGDFYALYDYESKPVMNPELNILLPRIHSSLPSHKAAYALWVPGLYEDGETVELSAIDADSGEETPLLERDYAMNKTGTDYEYNELGMPYHKQATALKPTFGQNMEFFFNYQLNHMYWRYFLWNFAGRQNDINNQYGEKDAGNWISGIPAIDDSRLGDQSLLPDELGKDNKGHNVYYMLPLLLGILGLLWQAFRGKRGIEQFWVVFFLFFMTGIAIVLYLNQPPLQPRERDYAFAGSFYAFAIWIGMGVAAIRHIILWLMERRGDKGAKAATGQARSEKEESVPSATKPAGMNGKGQLIASIVGAVIGLLVPLQMVSQTWDDHDRSGRYAARDYAINYLNSLEPNAIVFCNGDNDTFPLWYAQEVEGVRPDVKIINLSYLGSEWYANQQRMQTYDAAPVHFTAKPQDYAYGRRNVVYALPTEFDEHKKQVPGTDFDTETPLVDALKEIYAEEAVNPIHNEPMVRHANTFIEVDEEAVRKQGLVPDDQIPLDRIPVQLNSMTLGQLLMLDIIATNAADGWKRPIYWACTVGTENYQQFLPYVRFTGMAYQLVPYEANGDTDTEITYGIVKKYLWGGADNYENPPYFDETAGRMLSATRMSVLELAKSLTLEGTLLMNGEQVTAQAKKKFDMAAEVLALYERRLAGGARPMSFSDVYTLGTTYCTLGETLKDKKLTDKGLKVLSDAMTRYAQNVKYTDMLADKWGLRKSRDPQTGAVHLGLEVQTTPENSVILFSYFELVKVYNYYSDLAAHGYDPEACDQATLEGQKLTDSTKKVLKAAGISEALLNRLRGYYETDGSASSAEGGEMPGGYDMESLTEGIAQYAEVVVEMQGKTPQEYAAASEEERQIDSLFVMALQQYLYMGGTEEELMKYEIFNSVDMDRSMSVFDAYIAAHPEMMEELQDLATR